MRFRIKQIQIQIFCLIIDHYHILHDNNNAVKILLVNSIKLVIYLGCLDL